MQVILGTIVGVFGIKGEVKVKSNTDFGVIRFKKGNKVELCSKIGNKVEEKTIISHKESTKGLDIILFEGIDNPEMAQKYIGYEILLEKQDEELLEGYYHYADIWKCDVYYNDELIGNVIDMFDSGSHLILRIKREDKKDLLYPFVEKFIEKVDVENKKIYLSPIKGMID